MPPPRHADGAPGEAPDAYGRVASLYDRSVGPFLAPIRRRLARLAVVRGARRILDLCCGTGAQCLAFRAAGLSPVGVDLSPAMLARAGAVLGPAPPLARMDVTALALAAARFDVVSVCLALHEMPRGSRGPVLAEAWRVLAPGGLLAVVEYAAPETMAGRFFRPALMLVERLAGGEHWRNYLDFMRGGALGGLPLPAGATPVKDTAWFFGNVRLTLLSRPPAR